MTSPVPALVYASKTLSVESIIEITFRWSSTDPMRQGAAVRPISSQENRVLRTKYLLSQKGGVSPKGFKSLVQ
jgi:hypothetical protein